MADVLGSRRGILQRLCRDKDVLDLGCAGGIGEDREKFTHDAIRDVARSLLGVDIKERIVEECRRKGYDVICADAQDLNLGRRFDVVFAGELIEHLEDQGRFLGSVRRHLRPGGVLIISTPNAHDAAYHFNRLLGRMKDDYGKSLGIGHVVMHSYGTLRLLLERSGFRVTEHHYINSICQTRRRRLMGLVTRPFPDFSESILLVAKPASHNNKPRKG